MINSQNLQAFYTKALINLSRHGQDIQEGDDDPSIRHMILLIETLCMLMIYPLVK